MRWAKLQSFALSFFLMLRAKNYYSRPMFYEAVQKIKGYVFLRRDVLMHTALSGEAEHAVGERDEPMAGRAAACHRGMGRGRHSLQGLSALRGSRCGHHDQ